MRRIKKAFQKALSAKKAGNKKKSLKEFNKAISLFLKLHSKSKAMRKNGK